MEATTAFQFKATNEGELSFSAGVKLKIIDDSDKDWYKAEINGSEGYVPANYIQYLKPIWFMSVSKEQSVTLLSATNNGRPQHPDGAFLVRPSQNSPGDMSLTVKIGNDVQHFRILRSSAHGQYYLWSNAPHFSCINELVDYYRHESVSRTANVVLRDLKFPKVSADYDYTPRGEKEMELKFGDVITVVDDSDPNWWDGRLERNGVIHSGLFPSNYVHAI